MQTFTSLSNQEDRSRSLFLSWNHAFPISKLRKATKRQNLASARAWNRNPRCIMKLQRYPWNLFWWGCFCEHESRRSFIKWLLKLMFKKSVNEVPQSKQHQEVMCLAITLNTANTSRNHVEADTRVLSCTSLMMLTLVSRKFPSLQSWNRRRYSRYSTLCCVEPWKL